nr:unnamed protein product [Digitaria exilis]
MLNSAGVVGPFSPATLELAGLDLATFDTVMAVNVSKFTITGFVKATAAELCRLRVSINCMSPYAVPTLAETSVAAAVERHGRLDVMLNSAGMVGPLSLATLKLAGLSLAAVMAVNVKSGTLARIKHARRGPELCRLGVRINRISPYAVPTLMVVGQFSAMLQGAVGEEHWSRYEEVMSDPVKYVKRIATFLGVPFSIEEEDFGGTRGGCEALQLQDA